MVKRAYIGVSGKARLFFDYSSTITKEETSPTALGGTRTEMGSATINNNSALFAGRNK